MESRQVSGFVTVACMGHYADVLSEILDSLHESGLYDRARVIELAALGPDDDRRAVESIIRSSPKIRLGYTSADLGEYEFPALALLQDAARTRDDHFFYLHTKGVSRSAMSQHARYWRALMLHHVVERHAECLEALASHDCAGTNWRGNHYSGNFWWARAEHIRRLPDLRALRRTPRFLTTDPIWNDRLQCEFWIGMSPGNFKNFGPSYLDLYLTIRWPLRNSEVVNMLLDAQGGSRFLELALSGGGECFPGARAQLKHLVSPAPEATFSMTEDRFIASGLGEPEYDVVFVDSTHDEVRCLRAIEWAVGRVGQNGAVVVHDSNPPTEWHQRPAHQYTTGTEWNGEVWKAIVRFRQAHPDADVCTVDTDWGCTIIRPGWRAARRFELAPELGLDWLTFEQHRADWLGIISVGEFRRALHHVPFRVGRRLVSTRTDVINCLVSRHGLKRYLEIGVATGENFERVLAPIRQSVDPEGEPTFRMTSDEFFAGTLGQDRYDLIFIDGLHEADQCLRDMENALGRLCARGFIVVHDTNPPSEWHQRPRAEFAPGDDWNGDVWKAVVRFRRRHPEIALFTVDVDWGCTVICPARSAGRTFDVPSELSWAGLEANRRTWLNLQAPEEFAQSLTAR